MLVAFLLKSPFVAGYALVPTDSPVPSPKNPRRSPLISATSPDANQEEKEREEEKGQEEENQQIDTLDFKFLGQLSDAALEIIEPSDFLEILVDLFSALPDSFTSVAGEVLGKAKQVCFTFFFLSSPLSPPPPPFFYLNIYF